MDKTQKTYLDKFNGKINILLHCNKVDEIDYFQDIQDRFSIYNIKFINNLNQAKEFLLLNNYYIFVTNINANDFQDDLNFLNRNVCKHDFIYLCKNGSFELGFNLYRRGAKAAYSLPLNKIKVNEIFLDINKIFLNKILAIDRVDNFDMQVSSWVKILRDVKPQSVEEWARFANVDASYLRRRVKCWYKTSPKVIIDLYLCFCSIFKIINADLNDDYAKKYSSTELNRICLRSNKIIGNLDLLFNCC